MSQITTHVLDTSIGKPAAGIEVTLSVFKKALWSKLANGVTDADGRISDLLKPGEALEFGFYKLKFETEEYFESKSLNSFYPFVEITFRIDSGEHYHVPVLLNPFGYSTYKGS